MEQVEIDLNGKERIKIVRVTSIPSQYSYCRFVVPKNSKINILVFPPDITDKNLTIRKTHTWKGNLKDLLSLASPDSIKSAWKFKSCEDLKTVRIQGLSVAVKNNETNELLKNRDVKLINKSTSITIESRTDDHGLLVMPFGEPGLYRLEINVEDPSNATYELELDLNINTIYECDPRDSAKSFIGIDGKPKKQKDMIVHIDIPEGWYSRGSNIATNVPLYDPRGDNFGIMKTADLSIFKTIYNEDESMLLKSSSIIFNGNVIGENWRSDPLKAYKDLNDYVNQLEQGSAYINAVSMPEINYDRKKTRLSSSKENISIGDMKGFKKSNSMLSCPNGYWIYTYSSAIYLAAKDAFLRIGIEVFMLDDPNYKYQDAPMNPNSKTELENMITAIDSIFASLKIILKR